MAEFKNKARDVNSRDKILPRHRCRNPPVGTRFTVFISELQIAKHDKSVTNSPPRRSVDGRRCCFSLLVVRTIAHVRYGIIKTAVDNCREYRRCGGTTKRRPGLLSVATGESFKGHRRTTPKTFVKILKARDWRCRWDATGNVEREGRSIREKIRESIISRRHLKDARLNYWTRCAFLPAAAWHGGIRDTAGHQWVLRKHTTRWRSTMECWTLEPVTSTQRTLQFLFLRARDICRMFSLAFFAKKR